MKTICTRENSTLAIDNVPFELRQKLRKELIGGAIVGTRVKCAANDVNIATLARFGIQPPPGYPQSVAPIITSNATNRTVPPVAVTIPFDNFAFKTQCFDHQLRGFLELKERKFAAILWEMGLGKAKVGLDIAAYKHLCLNEIDCLCVVTLSGVHRNWIDREVPQHLAVHSYTAAAWHPTRKGNGVSHILTSTAFSVVAINFDSAWRKKGTDFLRQLLKTKRVMLLIDEAQGIKTHNAKRTKALLDIAHLATCRFIMTGTPVLSTPLDLWSQFEFLDPSIFEANSFYVFKARYAVEEAIPGVTHLEWRKDERTGKRVRVEVETRHVTGFRNIDDLKARIAPHSSRYTKDVLDLPPKLYRTHVYELPDDARAAYISMVKNLLIDLGDDKLVTAQMAITKLLRLRQLLCGFVKPEGSITTERFGATNPRLTALMDVCECVNGKAIIWATFRHSIDEIHTELARRYGANSVVEYSGRISSDDRHRAVDAMQNDANVRWFVGQQSAGGTGITLTAAQDVVYFNNDYSLGLRLQSEDRAHRIGSKGAVTYTDIIARGTIDVGVLESLVAKHDIANEITGDRVKEWLNDSIRNL